MPEARDDIKFLTQSELAKRWRASQSCVKNWSDQGLLPFFQIPGSTRVLYPLQDIESIEERFTRNVKGVKQNQKLAEIKGKKPEISPTSGKTWRI